MFVAARQSGLDQLRPHRLIKSKVKFTLKAGFYHTLSSTRSHNV